MNDSKANENSTRVPAEQKNNQKAAHLPWIVSGIVIAAIAGVYFFFGHAEAQSSGTATAVKVESEKPDPNLVKIE